MCAQTANLCLPLLRWAGGKQRLLRQLIAAAPPDVTSIAYHEPFLGAGSFFFGVQPFRSFLSDANSHLIDCLKSVRDNPDLVSRHLRAHAKLDSADHYYETRARYNASRSSAAQAARFIYLNRTGYNGVFRVNRTGAYNVPYGRLAAPRFPTHHHLRLAAAALQRATLRTCSYEDALSQVSAGDFVYLDPPYPALNGTAFFTHYTPSRFTNFEQRALAGAVQDLHKRGAKLLMSNADTPLIRELYADFQLVPLSQTRFVSCKTKKLRVDELLISNYPLP